MAALEILQLYGYRFKIELGFRQAVHVIGAYAYRTAIRRKLSAYHVYVLLGCIAQGLLQHLSINHTAEVWRCFRSWLRTMNPAMPPSDEDRMLA